MPIEVLRDRNGTFEPQIIQKGQTRVDGFDEMIFSLYSRGMTTREIQGHLLKIYGVEVSPDLIFNVTDAVLEEVREWQGRPLDKHYPILYLDAIRVKCRNGRHGGGGLGGTHCHRGDLDGAVPDHLEKLAGAM
jgi:putative transposase